MKSRNTPSNQLGFLAPTLDEQLNPKQELVLLAKEINWSYFECEFSKFYSDEGRPAHPIRLMVSLLMLKNLYSLSDESLVESQWVMNPYFQYFSGESDFQWKQPCAASDLVHFRKRIGNEGVEKIFKHSVELHGKDSLDQNVSIDTTVQEKNITFPTDAKLHKKIIDKCVQIAKKEKVDLRRSYVRTSKDLVRATYNSTHPKRKKAARSAQRKLKTIAGRLVREIRRTVDNPKYESDLLIYEKVLAQEKNSKDKIYSLHEPLTKCIAKGKAHIKYEFGCKASVVLTQKTGIIVGAMTFEENVYDGHTLEAVLSQTELITGKIPVTATVDRGYQGTQKVKETTIIRPSKPLKTATEYQKQKKRKHCRRRAAIEPVIGHLKSDYRVSRNFLKGQIGDSINFLMAASCYNLKKLMTKLRVKVFCLKFKVNFTQITFCFFDPNSKIGLFSNSKVAF